MEKSVASHESSRKHDLIAVAVIGLYCLLHFTFRLYVSTSMELDEAEQFLQATALYGSPQPLLYSFIVKTVSLLSGQNLMTIISVKYLILFIFYLSFYGLVRSYWDAGESLVVTASLALFPLYAYEFIRDLSHSILAAAIAAIAARLYIRMLSTKNMKFFFALLVTLFLGVFSKYVFVFFLAALVLSDVVVRERWKAMGGKRMLLLLMFLSLTAISLFILLNAGTIPFLRKILSAAHAGTLDLRSPLKILNVFFKSYMEVLIFAAIFLLFFRRHISLLAGGGSPAASFFRSLAVFSVLIPPLVVLLLQIGQFRARWLAPVMFAFPLAFFSLVDLKRVRRRANFFAYFCMAIAISILLVRVCVGFFPDVTGKKERIHIPFQALSTELKLRLGQLRAVDGGEFVIISDRPHLISNMLLWFPAHQYAVVSEGSKSLEAGKPDAIRKSGGVIVWDISAEGESIPKYFLDIFPSAKPLEPLRVPYVHSKEIFSMGIAIIPRVAP
jgi:hypothetical protein